MSSWSWRKEAACLGLDREQFFPLNTDAALALEARQVCGGCPVQQTCLEWALQHGVDDGIWGGLTSQDRRSYLLRRRRSSN